MRFILKVIGNFFWKIFGGIPLAFIWGVLGLGLSLTILAYPLGVRCFRIAYLVWKPFGKEVALAVDRYPISNILWGISLGMVLGVSAFISGVIFSLSIVGIPIGRQWFKVSKVSIFPFGAYIK